MANLQLSTHNGLSGTHTLDRRARALGFAGLRAYLDARYTYACRSWPPSCHQHPDGPRRHGHTRSWDVADLAKPRRLSTLPATPMPRWQQRLAERRTALTGSADRDFRDGIGRPT
jgi:hypothetical protein